MGLAARYLWWKTMSKALLMATPAFVAAMILSHAQPVFDIFSRGMVDLGELFYLLALWLPLMVYLSMPMILALAIGYAYALMLQDREITALNAAGVPMMRLVAPGMAAAVAGAIFCGAMSLYLVPVALPRVPRAYVPRGEEFGAPARCARTSSPRSSPGSTSISSSAFPPIRCATSSS